MFRTTTIRATRILTTQSHSPTITPYLLSLSSRSYSTPPSTISNSTTTSTTSTRQPTFTTPAPSLITESDELSNYDPSKPLPPTDLPVEDYASPLLHTASIFSNLFKYSVLTSVSIVLIGLTGLVGVHIWVEKVELNNPNSNSLMSNKVGGNEKGEEEWSEEFEGWSGNYLGGGTDPRLGTFARSAIRGAWISQHWGGGSIVSPVSNSTSSSSPFNVVGGASGGGTMIGSNSIASEDGGREVGDAGWFMAERYLIYALNKASDKGISLLFSDNKVSGIVEGESADRAAVELEERLAGIRERIGGKNKLEKAREGWERIYYSVGANSNPTQWEKNQLIKSTKKLGDISVRLSNYWKEGSEEKELEKAKAIGWFLGGLLPSLASRNKDILSDDTPGIAPSANGKKSLSPSSSFFGYWSRSHPPTTSSTKINKSEIKPELITLIHLLDHRDPSTLFSPSTSRLLLNSLVSLETFLARDRNLLAAQAVQRASLEFAQTLVHSSTSTTNNLPGTLLSPIVPKLDLSKPSQSLYTLFLTTRTSLLSTHLAEVSLALGGRKESESLLLFQAALADCEKVIELLSNSTIITPNSTLSKLTSAFSSKSNNSLDTSTLQSKYGKTARQILKDSILTASMTCNLLAFVSEKSKNFAGAEFYYSKSMKFSKDLIENGGDDKGFKEAERGFKRCKKIVLELEKERK